MAAPHSSLIDDEKYALRVALRRRRVAAHGDDLRALHTNLTRAIIAMSRMVRGHFCVAGFLPIGTEPDLTGLLTQLVARNMTVCLPDTPDTAGPLTFRRWTPGVSLRKGRFGTVVPRSDIVYPDLLLVPLLGFDAKLNRLGYGGGFYDRTIEALPGVHAIGVAMEALRVERVPSGPHDQPLDAIATEARIWR